MMRYCFFILGLFTLFACNENRQQTAPEVETPNIVLLFTDDQTYQAVAALGNNEIKTPNLDQLVKNGTTFTHAYNMGGWNGAICVASRAMIISGQSIWDAQKLHQNWREADSSLISKTWGKRMEQLGYETYMTGKWHVPIPAGKVFQVAEHIRPGMPRDNWQKTQTGRRIREEVDKGSASLADVLPIGYNRPLSEKDTSWIPYDTLQGGFWEGGLHWSEVVKNDALNFIEQSQKSEKPFFMYLAFNAPHDPRQAPKEFVDLYPIENINLPENWQANYPDLASINGGQRLRDEALAPFPRTEYSTKKHIQEYYAIISHLDEQVGKIMDALEESGQLENTVIFFTADHGLAVGSHGMLGKQNMYDHSIRVPLIAVGSPFPEGKKVDADVYLQDIMATSLELAGAAKMDALFFNSFLDLANGTSTQSHYPAIYGAYTKTQRMIRKDGFKLIVYPTINKVLLFDLNQDPSEINNLAEQEEYQEKVEALFADLLTLQKEMNDPVDLNPIYNQISTQLSNN